MRLGHIILSLILLISFSGCTTAKVTEKAPHIPVTSTRAEVEEIIGPPLERFETLAGDLYLYEVNVEIEVDQTVDRGLTSAGAGYATGATMGAFGIVIVASYLAAELSDSTSVRSETVLALYEGGRFKEFYWINRYFHVDQLKRRPPSREVFELACLTASLADPEEKLPQAFLANIYSPEAREDWNAARVVEPDARLASLWYRRGGYEDLMERMLTLLPASEAAAVKEQAETWTPNPHDCLFSD